MCVADSNNIEPKLYEHLSRLVYVYAMGQEPWLKYLTSIQYTDESHPIVESNKLVASCQSKGIESERLYCQKEIVLPGQPVTSRLAAAF